MQLVITPGLVTSLAALVIALEQSPTGGNYLLALTLVLSVACVWRRSRRP